MAPITKYYPHPKLTPLSDYSAGVRGRMVAERRICRKLIRTLRNAGYKLRVNSGDEWETPTDANEETLMRALFNLDDAWLVVSRNRAVKVGWVRLVFGNDGWDVISDYTVNLENVLTPVMEYASTFE